MILPSDLLKSFPREERQFILFLTSKELKDEFWQVRIFQYNFCKQILHVCCLDLK